MNKLKQLIDALFTRKSLQKIGAYGFLCFIFYFFNSFLGIFLLTFIFAYLFLSGSEFLKMYFDKFINKFCTQIKKKKIIKNLVSINFIIILEYILFISIFIFIVSDLVPKLITELSELPKNLPFLKDTVTGLTSKLEDIKNFNSELGGSINQIITNQDLQVLRDVFDKIKSASVVFLQIVLSLILSFVFLMDRFKINKYLLKIKKSSFSFFYSEYKVIFGKITSSFGLILKAQTIIAFINAILTVIGLFIIGLVHGGAFPYLFTLGLIVFIAGFIPVLGVFISSIPILLIAFGIIGGYTIIVEIILLITIVHVIEAYYLNPKIISKFINLPVSLTFVVLIISEHLFGIAGLIIGVSLFYFLIGLFKDFDKVIKKKQKVIKRLKK